MSAAILPPAPGLFSITTDWPHTSCRRLPTSRAVVSVEPPGVKGTTMRTVFEGQLMPALRAREESSDGAARLAAASATKRRRLSMDSSAGTWSPDCFGPRCARSLERGVAEINAAYSACHHPRMRVIQYSRDVSDRIDEPRRTGYPAFAGYDSRWADADCADYSGSSSSPSRAGIA